MKKALRRSVIELEKTLEAEYKRSSDAEIIRFVLGTEEYRKASCVFAFVGTEHEINTKELLSAVLRDRKKLCIPKCIGNGIMEAREISDVSSLRRGVYGIFEPSDSSPLVNITQIQFAVVPCVSCSHDGRRLGRGGGYYDRFLDDYNGTAAVVCRECLMRDIIPLEEHDVTVPIVVTDKAVYRNDT